MFRCSLSLCGGVPVCVGREVKAPSLPPGSRYGSAWWTEASVRPPGGLALPARPAVDARRARSGQTRSAIGAEKRGLGRIGRDYVKDFSSIRR